MLRAPAFVLLFAQASAQDARTCAGDEDEAALLQHSVLARSAEHDLQPEDGGPGAAIRAQVRALGGVCGQDAAGRCPTECPLTARDLSASDATGGREFCTFACVPATEVACVAYSPGEPVPDERLGICRAAMQRGCAESVEPSATMSLSEMNKCGVCSSGYTLEEDGTCLSIYRYFWYSLFAIVGVAISAVVAWLIDLALRPMVNEAGLEHGLATRSRAKLHTPKVLTAEIGLTPRHDGQSGRSLWPLSTNLCTTMVAGPGLTLFFNFMAMVIIWASVITVAWLVFAYVTDDAGNWTLLVLGTQSAVTPAETCEVVGWGYEMQQKFMSAKAVFVIGCYAWSFGLFVCFSIYQRRLFETLDERETTHMDFCAVLENLPSMPGNAKVEDELCDEIERTTGHRPVGVSIAWEMGELRQELMSVIDDNLDELYEQEDRGGGDRASMHSTAGDGGSLRRVKKRRERRAKNAPREQSSSDSDSDSSLEFAQTATGLISKEPPLRRLLMNVERAWLTPTIQKVISKGRRRDFEKRHQHGITDSIEEFHIEEELESMRSCRTAFAVFQTEEARDHAVNKVLKTGGMCFRNSVVTMHQSDHEPDSVVWTNFKDQHNAWKVLRCICGVLMIFFALALWTAIFYLPYAYYAMSFNYGHGQMPGMLEQSTFVMIIVCGNATMYLLCSEVADWCGFRYVGDRELCYLLLYYFACLLNVVLDMVCAYKVAYMALVGVGSRTHDGVLLADLTSFVERFEAYPMQLELGWTVFAYSFPCTFLLPFIAEPIATIILPYKIMTAIVSYRRDIQGSRADAFLTCTPMDLSRYADIALCASLATLVFWFPSGITLSMFGFCALSLVYIYCFDHWRVLRAVPTFSMSGMRTDCWAQAMLAVPCGLLLSCSLYKANCVEGLARFHPPAYAAHDVFGYCKEGEFLVMKCVAAFALHVVVHIVILTVVVPLFGSFEKETSKSVYSECARRLAHSYFACNPVHCLRSEYIYEHNPPFVYSRKGKEHLMPQNPEIGAYFADTSAMCEDFSSTVATISKVKSTMAWARNTSA